MKKISTDIIRLISLFKKHATTSPSSNETDVEFIEHIGFRFVMLFLLLVFFDTLIDILLTAINYLFEITHVCIEIIETLLELLLKYLLHTNHFQSEAILVNSGLILAAYICYKFIRNAPRLWETCSSTCSSIWQDHHKRTLSNWHALPLQRKLLLISAYAISSLCLIFFLPI